MRFLADMTWREVQGAARDGAMVVVPCGSTEQHGPHLPSYTDTRIVEAVSRGVAEKLTDAFEVLLAPTMAYGASDHHQGFFAMSLSERTYIDAVLDLCGGIREAGFSKAFLLNGHGGNTAPLKVVCALARKSHPGLILGTSDYWALAAPGIRKVRGSSPGGAAHAGEFETSMMMFLDPDSVKADLIHSNIPDLPQEMILDLVDGGTITTSAPWQSYAPDGHLGDAEKASAAKGEEFFQNVVTLVTRALEVFYRT